MIFPIFAPMKRILSIGLLLFVVLVAACSKRETPPPPEEDMLYRVECFYQTNLDSARQILDTLNLSALSEKELAHYCLLRLDALFDTMFYNAEIDSLLQVAENCFVGSDDKYFEAKSYYAKGYAYRSSPQHRWLCIDNYQKAKQSIDQCQHVDERFVRFSPTPTTEQDVIDQLKYKIYSGLGSAYGDFGYHNESLEVLKEAERFLCHRQWLDQHCLTALMIGELYLRFRDYDSSELYLEKGFHSAQTLGDTWKMAACHSSAALHLLFRYEKQKNVGSEERQDFLRDAIAEEKKALHLLGGQTAKFKASTIDGLTHAYFELGQYDSCIFFAKQAANQYGLEVWRMNANMYLYKSFEALGNMDSALLYAEKYMDDRHKYDYSGKAVAQVKEEYDKQLEIQRLESEQQLKRYRLYLWIALLVIVLMAVLWGALRYRKNKELETLKLREAQRQLQAELEQLTTQQRDMLQQQVVAIYQTEQKDRLQRIMEAFEAAYPRGVEKMKSAYPDLNKTERNLVVLSFLGFRIKEEADLLGLSENTVAKYRSKLNKKVDFDSISILTD